MGYRRLGLEEALIHKALTDPAFKEALMEDPKGAIEAEFAGIKLPQELQIDVHQETENKLILVLPARAEDIREPRGSVGEDISWGDFPAQIASN